MIRQILFLLFQFVLLQPQLAVASGRLSQVLPAQNSEAQMLPVLPYPQFVAQTAGVFNYTSNIAFKTTALSPEQSDRLRSHWQDFKSQMETSGQSGQLSVELFFIKDAKQQPEFWARAKSYQDSIGNEGYILMAAGNKIMIAANSETGLFYGLQSLRQLTRAEWKHEVFIADWPAFATRVIFDDISRGPISKVGFIKEQIARMAELKINYLSFYIEHVVQPLSHPDFAPENGKLTIDQIRELSAYAEKFHIKLIGSFQSFGHFEKILALPQYSSMGETGTLISPVDPKAQAFLKDVIGELCDAFSAPWFNVNCDETFDLNKGKSKAYIDSIGADRFYADHLNFLYGILKAHNKKMMLWGDVAIQYEKIPDMLPKDVVYLTWEYGSNDQYDKWIKPFASRGLEFMVCPGVLNSYRMFPDMLMAKSNIKGFIQQGKANGATGAFTTLWDDGGAYLFSADWYGVYAAAEKSWNLKTTNEKSFDLRYSKAAYGSDNDNYVQAVFKLLELRSLPLTYNLNDLLWQQQIVPEKGKQLWLNNTDLQKAEKILDQASDLLAGSMASFNTSDITAVAHTIAQYKIMIDTRRLLASQAAVYRQAIKLKDIRLEQARSLLIQSSDTLKQLKDRYVILRDNFRQLWRAENQEYWLDVVTAPYDTKIGQIAVLEQVLKNTALSAGAKLNLPAADQIGLAIYQTPYTYFQYWLLTGPFPSGTKQTVPAFMYSENAEYNKPPIPGGIAVYKGKNYRWHKFASKSGSMIDLTEYFGKKTPATAYAYCTLNVSGKDVTEAFVNAPGGSEVFCDGKKVAVISARKKGPAEQKIALSLSKGNHLFLLKIPARNDAPWRFSMRLADGVQVVNSKHKYQTNSKNKTYDAE
ncbi:glycoside hydrolase family 20 zincin-like fold domain-containing protein [Dyadobacter psychrotolerans]|uniref:beta-N-acetylhexosaminidase n=1 Tax=Dyadobacter psychrotolerans TaxID=2541721 RepID=A0A4R5DVF4_9BACT|nr:glycoside hydrolase family 20 zincin-like fold domain-containing protein [Dyadobacter psychrotolerans]TDE15215.1 glycoside hydrolase [Dyadobacter psychrotolerans]